MCLVQILEQFLKKGEVVVCVALNVHTVNWSSQVYLNEDEGSMSKLCEEGNFKQAFDFPCSQNQLDVASHRVCFPTQGVDETFSKINGSSDHKTALNLSIGCQLT